MDGVPFLTPQTRYSFMEHETRTPSFGLSSITYFVNLIKKES